MKRYIAVRFDGWYWSYHIINEPQLNDYNDGSFDNTYNQDGYKWDFYELGQKLDSLPFTTKNEKTPN